MIDGSGDRAGPSALRIGDKASSASSASGHEQFARMHARQLGGDLVRLDRRDRKGAGGHVAGRDGEGAAGTAERRQRVGGARFQQRILGQGPRGDKTHDLALHDGLRAALLGLRRILHLLADRDPEALADQLLQIAFRGVNRHAAHRDILALVLAALGERDVQRLRRLHRVVEEQLVEIAHAVKEEIVGMRRLGRQVLRHHRRRRFGRSLTFLRSFRRVFVHVADFIMSQRLLRLRH